MRRGKPENFDQQTVLVIVVAFVTLAVIATGFGTAEKGTSPYGPLEYVDSDGTEAATQAVEDRRGVQQPATMPAVRGAVDDMEPHQDRQASAR
jgi:hypothetical protein